ncbi:hypothetical protein AA313_de0206151 [Arthrobotrys entomopaga]|nr:hypothetical protein AA313_de0206151 [Arthrobotrys entomopaga]
MSGIPDSRYNPRNNLGARNPPKFGETTPLKGPGNISTGKGIGRGGNLPPPSWNPTNLMRPNDPKWKEKPEKPGTAQVPIDLDSSPAPPVSLDSSPDIQGPFVRPPQGSQFWQDFPKSSKFGGSGFNSFKERKQSAPFDPYAQAAQMSSHGSAGTGRPMDDLSRWAAPIRGTTGMIGSSWAKAGKGTTFTSDGYMYNAEDYMDSKAAMDSIKSLLENINDEPPSRRTRAKKKAAEKAANAEKKEGAEEDEEEEEEDGSVDGLKVTLLPHQIRGLAWLLKQEDSKVKGGILADDMGLGKTIQSISLILSNPMPSAKTHTALEREKYLKEHKIPAETHRGTLIVAPLALIKQWEKEIKEKTDNRHRVLVHHGPGRTRAGKDLKTYDVVVTTPQVLVSEHKDSLPTALIGCFDIRWWRVIIDEAHTIKNHLAKSTIACYALRSHFRWCLTGTPLQNNVDELQSLIRFLRVEPYADKGKWKQDITRLLNSNKAGLALKRIRALLGSIMLRRTKAVLQAASDEKKDPKKAKEATDPKAKTEKGEKTLKLDMVKRSVKTVSCAFDGDEDKFYRRLESRMDSRLNDLLFGNKKHGMAGVLVIMTRLRQACNHPHLIAGKLTEDKERVFTSTKTPKKSNGGSRASKMVDDTSLGEIDDLADIMGGMKLENRPCEVCQTELPKAELERGYTRCKLCREDLGSLNKKFKEKRVSLHRQGLTQAKTDDGLDDLINGLGGITVKDDQEDDEEEDQKVKNKPQPRRNRRIIIDSDEEDDDNEPISPVKKTESDDDDEAEEGEEEDDDDDDDEEDDESREYPENEFVDDEAIESSGEESDGAPDTTVEDVTGITLSGSDSEYESDIDEPDPSNSFASAKIRNLMKILKKEVAEENKTIVFSAFTSMLDMIEPFLKHRGIKFVRYDGKMKNDDRERSLDTLRTSPTCQVLLCSLKCGALGLNLTAANRVVILEPFWNPFVEEQAIDRVHRIGQTSDVVVYRMSIGNTIESRIQELQDRKRKIAEAAFGTGDLLKKGETGKLTKGDLLFLFKKDAEQLHNDDEELAFTLGSKLNLMDNSASTRGQDTYSTPPVHRSSASQRSDGRGSRPGGSSKPRVERKAESQLYGRR